MDLDGRRDLTVVFDHPIMLLLSGIFCAGKRFWRHSRGRARSQGSCLNRFLGVTINPYTPTGSGAGKYIAAHVPPELSET